jgi:hypothetical protein
MSFNSETQGKINQFAKEQSRHYLDAAQMTYMEKLRYKAGSAKRKAAAKLARFKNNSEQAVEAQNDMILYMSDYMSDLISKGMTEQDAFEKAKEELAASGDSDVRSDYAERLAQCIMNRDPAADEAIGLFYGGFVTAGLVVGALAGYIGGGGRDF